MAQHPIILSTTPPYPGLQMVQDTNNALEALATDFSGPTDPAASAKPYSTWVDTSVAGYPVLRRRNAGNTQWLGVSGAFGNEFLGYALGTPYSLPAGTPTPLRPDVMQANTFPAGAYATATGVITLPAGGAFRISGHFGVALGASPAVIVGALYSGASGSTEVMRSVELHTDKPQPHAFAYEYTVYTSAVQQFRVMVVTTATGSAIQRGLLTVQRLTSRQAG